MQSRKKKQIDSCLVDILHALQKLLHDVVANSDTRWSVSSSSGSPVLALRHGSASFWGQLWLTARCLLKQLPVTPLHPIHDTMRARLRTLASLLWLALSLTGVAAKKDKPEVSETGFKSIPQNLFYFDDSDVVMVTDVLPGIVYRSTNAGSDWTPIKDITEGQVLEVLRHPWNNQVAVAIGIEKTHWITKDQGKTWKAFKTAFPPVFGRLPISFHAADPERMIFHVADCMGFDCTMKVRLAISRNYMIALTRIGILHSRWLRFS